MATSPDLTQRVLSWPPMQRVLSLPLVARLLGWARFDASPDHRPPGWRRVALATVLSIALSLAADAILVAIGTRVFPATQGYVHFQFSDYAKLTVVGVVIACAAWPIVARVCAAPRWLFFRLAIAVSLVLLLPDVWIWLQGESAQAVAVLVVLHVAIALITYNLLVHLAPVRPAIRSAAGDARSGAGAAAGGNVGAGARSSAVRKSSGAVSPGRRKSSASEISEARSRRPRPARRRRGAIARP